MIDQIGSKSRRSILTGSTTALSAAGLLAAELLGISPARAAGAIVKGGNARHKMNSY